MTVVKQKAEPIFNAAGIAHLHEQTHVSKNAARNLLNRRVEHGELVKLFRGTYINRTTWPSTSDFENGVLKIKAAFARARLQAIAMAQVHPNRVLTGYAAALVHGLPLLDLPRKLTLSSLTLRSSHTRKTSHEVQFLLNYQRVLPEHETIIDGARVTTLARTVVDIAAAQPRVDNATRRKPEVFRRFAEAIALADGALRGSVGTLGSTGMQPQQALPWPEAPPRFEPPNWDIEQEFPQLAAQRHVAISNTDFLPHVHDQRGRVRGPRTLEVLMVASPWSESAFESVTKALLMELKLSFEQQPRIVDESGVFVARVDFLLPAHGIIIECDGRMKYEPAQSTAQSRTQSKMQSEARAGAGQQHASTANIWHDRCRDYQLANLGYAIIHLTWDAIFDGSAAGMIRKALAASTTPRGRWFDAITTLPKGAYKFSFPD